MTPYQLTRAKQRERDAMKTAGAMKLHRIVDLESDDFCAEEGAFMAPPEPIKTVEAEYPWLWMLYGVAILATIAACSLIANFA